MQTIDQQIDSLQPDWTNLVRALIPTIEDDYRASDFDDEDSEPSMTTKETIEKNRDKALACQTTGDIKNLLETLGLKTQHRWGKALEAIKAIGGPDYYALRDQESGQQAQQLADSVTHEVALYSDAKANRTRFGICDVLHDSCWGFDDAKYMVREALSSAEYAIDRHIEATAKEQAESFQAACADIATI